MPRAAAFFDLDKTLMAGSSRDAVRAGRDAARHRQPPPARQLGGRAPALPAARDHRRAHHRGAQAGPGADRRRPGARHRADEPGGAGGGPAADLPADAGRGPRATRTPAAPPSSSAPPATAWSSRWPTCWAWTAASAPATRSTPTAPSPAASTGPSSTAPARSRRWRRSPPSTRSTSRQSYAYSDSLSDLPMLRGGRPPVVVNPDPALAEIAKREGWQTMRFERLGRRLVADRGHRCWRRLPASADRGSRPAARCLRRDDSQLAARSDAGGFTVRLPLGHGSATSARALEFSLVAT